MVVAVIKTMLESMKIAGNNYIGLLFIMKQCIALRCCCR